MANQNPGIRVPTIRDCKPSVRQSIQDIIRHLGTSSAPTYGTIKLTSLSADKLIKTSSSNELASADISEFLTGTTNRITITDNGDGTATLSTPQDTHTGASPTFNDLTLSNPSNIYALSHNSFADYAIEQHRIINDASTSTTELWSSDKINSEISGTTANKIFEREVLC